MLEIKLVGNSFRNTSQKKLAEGTQGLNAKHFCNLENFLKKRQGLLDPREIQSNHPLLKDACFFICLALAISVKAEKVKLLKKLEVYETSKLTGKYWSNLQKLYTLCGLELGSALMEKDLPTISDILYISFDRQLVLYEINSSEKSDFTLVYKGTPELDGVLRKIIIILWNKHSYLVIKPNYLSSLAKLCKHCGLIMIPNTPHHHDMVKKCSACQSSTCYNANYRSNNNRKRGFQQLTALSPKYFCNSCRCFYRSALCYSEHKTRICQEYAR